MSTPSEVLNMFNNMYSFPSTNNYYEGDYESLGIIYTQVKDNIVIHNNQIFYPTTSHFANHLSEPVGLMSLKVNEDDKYYVRLTTYDMVKIKKRCEIAMTPVTPWWKECYKPGGKRYREEEKKEKAKINWVQNWDKFFELFPETFPSYSVAHSKLEESYVPVITETYIKYFTTYENQYPCHEYIVTFNSREETFSQLVKYALYDYPYSQKAYWFNLTQEFEEYLDEEGQDFLDKVFYQDVVCSSEPRYYNFKVSDNIIGDLNQEISRLWGQYKGIKYEI